MIDFCLFATIFIFIQVMASVGDTICAAPFAVIGSIGVVTQIPNFQRFLNKHDIDAFLFTAGKHKVSYLTLLH